VGLQWPQRTDLGARQRSGGSRLFAPAHRHGLGRWTRPAVLAGQASPFPSPPAGTVARDQRACASGRASTGCTRSVTHWPETGYGVQTGLVRRL